MNQQNNQTTQLKRLFKISRPKFWHYLAGPYALGVLLTYKQLSPEQLLIIILGFFWFLFIGNFIVYGINDLSDHDTDQFNSDKKNNQDEALLATNEQNQLKKWLIFSFLSGIIVWGGLALFQKISLMSLLSWISFIFFAWSYSAKPIRAKQHPFLDGIFNILYILPAFTAYSLSQQIFNLPVFISGILWCMAMHAFSAIPDIDSDQKAGLTTTAVFLGPTGTLIYCLFCYLLAEILLFNNPFYLYWLAGLLVYQIIIIYLLFRPVITIKKFYKYFPLINLFMGMYLFLVIFFKVI